MDEQAPIQDNKPTAEDFFREYTNLSKRTGFTIAVSPEWFKQDNGTYSLKIDVSVAPLPAS